MSLIPLYILSGLLGLTLVIREIQHQQLIKALINKILESNGMQGIPETNPMASLFSQLAPSGKEAAKPEKKIVDRVNFKIPGAPQFRGK